MPRGALGRRPDGAQELRRRDLDGGLRRALCTGAAPAQPRPAVVAGCRPDARELPRGRTRFPRPGATGGGFVCSSLDSELRGEEELVDLPVGDMVVS